MRWGKFQDHYIQGQFISKDNLYPKSILNMQYFAYIGLNAQSNNKNYIDITEIDLGLLNSNICSWICIIWINKYLKPVRLYELNRGRKSKNEIYFHHKKIVWPPT